MTMGLVGSGVQLALDGDSIIGRVRSLQMPEWVTEAVDFSGLDNNPWLTFMPGSMGDPGTFTAELYLDPKIKEPTLNLIQTATITFPLMNSGGQAATLIGSGFIISVGWPNAAIAEPMIMPISFKYDGDGTPPAFATET